MSDALTVLAYHHGTLAQAAEKERIRWENETIDALGRMHREYLRYLDLLTSGVTMTHRAREIAEKRVEFFGNQSDRLEKKLNAHILRMTEFSEVCRQLVERKTCAMLPASVIPSGYDDDGTGTGL